jgi:hypothetical protein
MPGLYPVEAAWRRFRGELGGVLMRECMERREQYRRCRRRRPTNA